MNETLDQKLAALKLGRMRQVYPSWVELAAQSELGYAQFLDQLVTEELLARQENQLRRKMKAAGFPYAATIEQFDFAARLPNSSALCSCAFLTAAVSPRLARCCSFGQGRAVRRYPNGAGSPDLLTHQV